MEEKQQAELTEEVIEESEQVADPQQELLDQVEKLSRENDELKNQYFKAYADAENFKKRTQKELESAMKYRIQSFAGKILPVIDNLERALKSETSDEMFKQGVQMVYDQLMSALKEEGVTEIDALNQPFDGNYHQALVSEVVEGVQPGMVVEVLQKGYLLKDRIIRASLVKVSE